MKYLLLFITLLISLSSFAQQAPAGSNTGGQTNKNYDSLSQSSASQGMSIYTYTSEPCGLSGEGDGVLISGAAGTQTARYRCEIKGATGFIDMIGEIYKYVFFISLILGVLYVVGLGLAVSLSGAFDTEEMKNAAKKKALDVFGGLMALALIPWILKTVAPFFFN